MHLYHTKYLLYVLQLILAGSHVWLDAYKFIDAYNIVVFGHAQDIRSYNYSSSMFVALKAEVLPNQMP